MKLNKILIGLGLALSITLVGCENSVSKQEKIENSPTVKTYESVNVVEKNKRLRPYRLVVTVEKNGETIDLYAKSEDTYDILKEGNTIDIGVNKDFYIQEISFPKLEE